MSLVATCLHCQSPKPIFRKVAIADHEGVILDSAFYCENCWKQARVRSAVDELDLEDGK